MKRAIFQLHWIAGSTIGAALAFSGLTGSLMAFGPELTRYFHGGYAHVDGNGAPPLPVTEIYTRLHRDNPTRTITDLVTYADAGLPARVRFEVPTFMGPTAPVPETHMVDPYTGGLLPVRNAGRRMERFMYWLHEVHQGHWGGPGAVAAIIGATAVGYGAALLFFMALSGLYLRWPRGSRAASWRDWFWINGRLKGRAFLWNLHAVAGTCALLAFLVSAHTGAFQSGRVLWYANGSRALLGLQPIGHRPPPAPRQGAPAGSGPDGAQVPGPPPAPPGGGAGGGGGYTTLVAFLPGGYFDADGDAVKATTYRVDRLTGHVEAMPARAATPGVGGWVEANNQILHEGRYFGRAGTAFMMLASLALPGFYITGWWMYLKRRERRNRGS